MGGCRDLARRWAPVLGLPDPGHSGGMKSYADSIRWEITAALERTLDGLDPETDNHQIAEAEEAARELHRAVAWADGMVDPPNRWSAWRRSR